MQKKLFVILLSLLFVSPWSQGFPEGSGAVILNSKNLIPYVQAIQGVKQILGKKTPVYEMNANPRKGKILVNYAVSNGVKVIVAVGALAVEAAEKQSQVPVVFTMILHSALSCLHFIPCFSGIINHSNASDMWKCAD